MTEAGSQHVQQEAHENGLRLKVAEKVREKKRFVETSSVCNIIIVAVKGGKGACTKHNKNNMPLLTITVDVDTEAYTRLHDAVFNQNVAVQEPAPEPEPIPANVANPPEPPVPIPANAANPTEPPLPNQQPIGEPRAEALGNALLALLQTVANEFRQQQAIPQ